MGQRQLPEDFKDFINFLNATISSENFLGIEKSMVAPFDKEI